VLPIGILVAVFACGLSIAGIGRGGATTAVVSTQPGYAAGYAQPGYPQQGYPVQQPGYPAQPPPGYQPEMAPPGTAPPPAYEPSNP